MITVILRDGRVLEYNEANYVSTSTNEYTLRETEGVNTFIVILTKDIVERIESSRPCRIMKDKRNKKKMKIY